MRKKKDFLFGAFILSASNLLIKLIGAVFRVPLTEIVGVTAMGYFSSAYNIYNLLLSIATAGSSYRNLGDDISFVSHREVERYKQNYEDSGSFFCVRGSGSFCFGNDFREANSRVYE